jgi:hypothetical protein
LFLYVRYLGLRIFDYNFILRLKLELHGRGIFPTIL